MSVRGIKPLPLSITSYSGYDIRNVRTPCILEVWIRSNDAKIQRWILILDLAGNSPQGASQQ